MYQPVDGVNGEKNGFRGKEEIQTKPPNYFHPLCVFKRPLPFANTPLGFLKLVLCAQTPL
jgi:hypothetical protein